MCRFRKCARVRASQRAYRTRAQRPTTPPACLYPWPIPASAAAVSPAACAQGSASDFKTECTVAPLNIQTKKDENGVWIGRLLAYMQCFCFQN